MISLAVLAAVFARGAAAASQTARPDALEVEARTAIAWFAVLAGSKTPPESPGAKSRCGPTALPVSFVCGSERSADILGRCASRVTSRALDPARVEQTTTWTDAKTGLEIRVEALQFRDFPAVEWVVWFKNRGASDTPILAEVLPLDARFPLGTDPGRSAVLHYAKGALCCLDDFAPVRQGPDRGQRPAIGAGWRPFFERVPAVLQS